MIISSMIVFKNNTVEDIGICFELPDGGIQEELIDVKSNKLTPLPLNK